MRATCIMPTFDRRAFVPRAVASFLAQDVDDIELVILDDGADPVRDCVPEHPRIRYLRHPERRTIGAKRNALCREARGEIVLHWDDDDWYPERRVRVQVEAFEASDVDICGSRSIFLHNLVTGSAYCYEFQGIEDYVAGSTLAYRRSFWETNPFREIQQGEDTHFVRARRPRKLVDLVDPSLCVAAIHPHNSAVKRPAGRGWSKVATAMLPGEYWKLSPVDIVVAGDADRGVGRGDR